MVRRTKREISRSSEHNQSIGSGPVPFLSIIYWGLLLFGLFNLAGCLSYTGTLGTIQSVLTSNAPTTQSAPVPPQATPSSVAFGNVVAGVNYGQTVRLSNVGPASLTVTQVAASGQGFSVSGLSLPLTLTAGQSASLAITFDSTAVGSDTGIVSVASNAVGSPTTISLSATVGSPVVQISANPVSISFGNTPIGVTTTQNVTLTNTGNSTVSISSISTGSAVFTVSGAPNVTLAPNQSVNLAVNFDPSGPGVATGNLVVTSNAPEVRIGLSGTGAAASQYSVALTWSPSTSVVVGYYVYRGTGANAQLSKLNGEIVSSTSFQDTDVVSGQVYTYAVTAVNSNNVESALSTTATATIP